MTLILQTERLQLAPLAVADIDLALELFTDPEVVKYVGGLTSEDEIRQDMPVWTKRGGDGCIGIWCVSERSTGEKLGTSALTPLPIDEDDTEWEMVVPGVMPDGDVEVGYILKQAAWGKGYATEICRRLLRFAFENTPLQEVVATFDDENQNSRNVLSKCGLTERGRRKAYGEDGCPDWRISRSEWLQLSDSGGTG